MKKNLLILVVLLLLIASTSDIAFLSVRGTHNTMATEDDSKSISIIIDKISSQDLNISGATFTFATDEHIGGEIEYFHPSESGIDKGEKQDTTRAIKTTKREYSSTYLGIIVKEVNSSRLNISGATFTFATDEHIGGEAEYFNPSESGIDKGEKQGTTRVIKISRIDEPKGEGDKPQEQAIGSGSAINLIDQELHITDDLDDLEEGNNKANGTGKELF